MAHSIPDAAAVVIETPAGRVLHTRRLEARPHPGRRAQDRRRSARRARQPRRRPPARRLDERGAARDDRLGAAGRRGVPPAHPAAHRADHRRVVRVEHPPRAAGGRGRDRERAQGRGRRPLDAEEHEHRTQPRLRRSPGRRDRLAEGGDGAPARRGADPLHREPGRADVRADPDRVRRPPERRGRARATR